VYLHINREVVVFSFREYKSGSSRQPHGLGNMILGTTPFDTTIFATTILGMTDTTFTALHVLLSVIGIASGLLVVYGPLTGKRFDGATAIFLVPRS
jgi:hypothetical protein